ncbi:hypothetical protein EA797_03630 [Stutzerimonas zhaodongensis]|uniref:Uncharacterized protein n=1 Tax=Stutzerimonas zhaodongensis TaxID=1176257 RepID=A0A3M2HWR0_9GAMM|nr:hypothetical protein EA797_03630 [Stutzerimonas zhaodongensis]
MMSAPVDRDKDAVFKHKRVAETKGCTRVAVDRLFMPVRDRRFVPCIGPQLGPGRFQLPILYLIRCPLGCHPQLMKRF